MTSKICMAAALCLGMTVSAEAQLGTLVREGVKALSRTAGRSGTKAVKESGKRLPAPSRVVRSGGSQARRAAGQSAASPSAKVITRFGDEGRQALRSLSPAGTKQFASVADDIAASGHQREWLKVIAKHGDKAVQWIAKRKMAIAVGTAATAVVMAPDEFLQSAEGVTSTAIETAGQHVAKPLIAESARHIARPMAEEAAKAIPWPIVGLTGGLLSIGCCGWWLYRRRQHRQ